ncbi:MAG: condensation domain-containing protein, partial [Acidobacteriota bacterium]
VAAIGVAGQIYVGGAGLAQGYLNRAEMTAERFIPNPFTRQAGARLYQTGDMGRYLADGNIEYLGRVDNQIKLRGFRIELAEIESVILQHSSVREAVVIAREDKPSEKRLVAYLVIDQQVPVSIEAIREHLQRKLPEYMVPFAVVLLNEFPLTGSGKIDRQALPAPEQPLRQGDGSLVMPRTQIEKTLASIWMEVLGINQVGIHDNYFELGGDSILSIQIIARANQAGLKFLPKQIFQYRTIAELAAVVELESNTLAEQGIVTGALPLTPIQHWFFENNFVDPHHFNQSVLLELSERLDPVLLESAIAKIISHHDALRLSFILNEAGWQQINRDIDNVMPFSRIDLSTLSESQQRASVEIIAAQLQERLNLSEGPILRIALFDLGLQKPARLLIIIHHLAVDETSWRILLEDLYTAYQQLSLNGPVKLPLKTASFKQWSDRLIDYSQSKEIKEELSYWLSLPWYAIRSFPIDYPNGENLVASVSSVSVSLNSVETEALLQEVSQVYHTNINDTLLTALVRALSFWTEEKYFLIDLEGYGREGIIPEIDLSRTLGWFTTSYPVVLKFDRAFNLADLLKSIKEQIRTIPNRGSGYGLLRYLCKDRECAESINRLPSAEISFNYFGQWGQTINEISPFGLIYEGSGPNCSPQQNRKYLLEVSGSIINGQLRFDWFYSENLHHRTTIKNLAENFAEALRLIIKHCQSPDAGGYTPSDFPKAKLAQKELDKVLAKIKSYNKG